MADDNSPLAELQRQPTNIGTSILTGRLTYDAEEDDDDDETSPLFYVNKEGFPMGSHTWDRMWTHASKIHSDGRGIVANIRGNSNLPKVIYPTPPNLSTCSSVETKLLMIQKYIESFQYNHTGTQFFEIKKNRPLNGLMDSAKEMMRDCLPIKCLEAVILAIYLTNGLNVERFPLSFWSYFENMCHRHVVLAVYCNGRYGCLGLSRRSDLMYKPLVYNSLSEVVFDYETAYKQYGHKLSKVKLGLPVPHDAHSFQPIWWRFLSLNLSRLNREHVKQEIERYAREMRTSKVPTKHFSDEANSQTQKKVGKN